MCIVVKNLCKGLIMKKLLTTIILVCSTAGANADIYYCEDTMGVSIDRFDFEVLNDDSDNFISHNWLIDTDRGWRRTDTPHYGGVCEVNKGYTVCNVHNIPFGEATFAIHPDGSNFTLVYLDYGLDVLAFVGTCTKT
jgi:hypothetical protein